MYPFFIDRDVLGDLGCWYLLICPGVRVLEHFL